MKTRYSIKILILSLCSLFNLVTNAQKNNNLDLNLTNLIRGQYELEGKSIQVSQKFLGSYEANKIIIEVAIDEKTKKNTCWIQQKVFQQENNPSLIRNGVNLSNNYYWYPVNGSYSNCNYKINSKDSSIEFTWNSSYNKILQKAKFKFIEEDLALDFGDNNIFLKEFDYKLGGWERSKSRLAQIKLENERREKIKEEEKRKEDEQKRLVILENEKKASIRQLEIKRQDSIIKRNKFIDDSLKLISYIKEITENPVVLNKTKISKINWEGTGNEAIFFKNKYLSEDWRIPTIKEMRNIISPPLFSKVTIKNLGIGAYRDSKYFLCIDNNNTYFVIKAITTYKNCGYGLCLTTDISEEKCNMDEKISLRFVSDK